MSDKLKSVPAPSRPASSGAVPKTKPLQSNKNQTLNSRTRTRVPPTTVIKDRTDPSVLNDIGTTVTGQDVVLPEFEEENRQIKYGRFLRAMLVECLVSKKIQREESEMDIQMAQLAKRFQKTVDQLDMTYEGVKEISYNAEVKRLIDLKNTDSLHFNDIIVKMDSTNILKDPTAKEQASLDQLETKNVDFGYNKNNGYQQLLDMFNDALSGSEEIKKHLAS